MDNGTAGLTRRGFLGIGAGGAAAAGLGLLEPRLAAASVGLESPRQADVSGGTREYWVQVDSFAVDLAPSRRDGMMGTAVPKRGTTFWGLGYRAYSPNWAEPLPASDDLGANNGIPGPVLRAQVGDTIVVHFKNNDTHFRWPHSIHPHGVTYTPENDGAYIAAVPDRPGTAVPFGQTYTYTWTATPASVGTWPYHDHSLPQRYPKSSKKSSGGAHEGMNMGSGDEVMELSAELGLFGILAVTDAATTPVDREFCLFFHDLYQEEVPVLAHDFDCFNGRSFLGNTPTYTAKVGERVRWRVAALGNEFHVFHVHGHRWKDEAGRDVDSQIVGPSTALTVEYAEDNPGDWLYHCHVVEHMQGGMVGWYKVTA